MRVNDAITGAILLLFSAAVFAYSETFPKLLGMQFSAGFWPQTLSVAMGLCAVTLVFQGLRTRRAGGAWVELDDWWSQSGTVLTVFLVPGSILFYILLSDFLGFIICSLIILTVLCLRFGLSIVRALTVAVLTTAVMHLVFAEGLLVALPLGVLEPLVYSGT